MKTIKIIALVLFFSFNSSLQAQQESEIVNCLYNAYQGKIDFYKVLDKLESDLLDRGVIQDSTGLDYQMLVERLNEGNNSFDLDQIKVAKYLSSEAFTPCVQNAQTQAQLDRTMRIMFLMAIYLDISKRDFQMKLLIDSEAKIWVNGKRVVFEELEPELLRERQKLIDAGVPEQEVQLEMMVAPENKMGFTLDIQRALRHVGIRKINFSVYRQ